DVRLSNTGVIEKAQRQRIHAGGSVNDQASRFLSLDAEDVANFLEQHLTEAPHRPEGGPEVVGDRIGKRFELPDGPLELPSTLAHTGFQVEVQRLESAMEDGRVQGHGDSVRHRLSRREIQKVERLSFPA